MKNICLIIECENKYNLIFIFCILYMYLQSIVCTLLYESIFPFGYFNDIKLQYEFLVAKATSKIVYRE